MKRFFGSSIPRTIIIDKNKVIRWSIVGASTDMYIKIKELVVSELY